MMSPSSKINPSSYFLVKTALGGAAINFRNRSNDESINAIKIFFPD
jgi:hypothetical protein